MNESLRRFFESRLTVLLLLWIGFIVCNTFLGRQVLNLLRSVGGRGLIITVIILAAVGAVLLLHRELTKAGVLLRLMPLVILLLLAVSATFMIPIVEERLHIIKYGGLGFLAQALVRDERLPCWLAVIVVMAISIIDEGIQHLLPYRVGDLRDVSLNIISGLWGMVTVQISANPDFS
jgi:hypothetical protein